jgi:hypothetical protein
MYACNAACGIIGAMPNPGLCRIEISVPKMLVGRGSSHASRFGIIGPITGFSKIREACHPVGNEDFCHLREWFCLEPVLSLQGRRRDRFA